MIKKAQKLIIFSSILFSLFSASQTVFGESIPEKVRVFYRPDGGVSILSVTGSSCQNEVTEDECLERAAQDSPTTLGLPYDDMYRDQLPQDKSGRDKWRGSKGGGIWVDAALVTKSEKIKELEEKINEELDKDSPNLQRTAKLERLIKKAKDMPNAVLSAEDLAQLEEKKKSLLAVAVEAVGNFLQGIFEGLKDGILALRNIIIGTPEAPSGVTIYDVVTKQPYCSVVASGQTVNIPGECSAELIRQHFNGSATSNSDPGASTIDNTNKVQLLTEPQPEAASAPGLETIPVSEPVVEPAPVSEPVVEPAPASEPALELAPAPVLESPPAE